MVQKAPIGDSEQPASYTLNLGQLRLNAKRFEKRLLRQLVSKGTILTKPAQKGSDRALMGADDGLECVSPGQMLALFFAADHEPQA